MKHLLHDHLKAVCKQNSKTKHKTQNPTKIQRTADTFKTKSKQLEIDNPGKDLFTQLMEPDGTLTLSMAFTDIHLWADER